MADITVESMTDGEVCSSMPSISHNKRDVADCY